MLTVDVASVIRATEPRVIGINTNFITDHATMRQAGGGYEAALRKMGVRSLRYPGGEKSDEFLWSTPPWDAPRPTLCLTGPKGRLASQTDYVENYTTFRHEPLDFDQFIETCQSLGAEPVICVCFDSMYLPPVSEKGTAPTKAQLLANAVEWVRYSNVVKGYGVRYWELGNESYLCGGNGGAMVADYARDYLEFARAMRAVDPTIKIGANGHIRKNSVGKSDQKGDEDATGPIWWQVVLETAAPEVDFVVVHPYPCWRWGSYDYYTKHNDDFCFAVDQACLAMEEWAAPEDAERIRVFATELNAVDWAASPLFPEENGWPLVNDLGHAVVLFEILGQHLLHPKVDMAQVWNTRWLHPEEKQIWNALDESNDLNAIGHAIAAWGRHLEAQMVEATSTDTARAFASFGPEDKALSIFVVNKETAAQDVAIELRNYIPTWEGAWSILHGEGPEDQNPTFDHVRDLAGEGGELRLTLDPVSISVVTLKPKS